MRFGLLMAALATALCEVEEILGKFPKTAMISFDEGPTKNTEALMEVAKKNDVPIVFFLNPYDDRFAEENLSKIKERGFEIGMLIVDEVSRKEYEIYEMLRKAKEEFTRKSGGYIPKMVRLPGLGIDTIGIANCLGMLVSMADLDAKDDLMPRDFINPFFSELENKLKCTKPFTIALRERNLASVNRLNEIAQKLKAQGFKIVSSKEYYDFDTSLGRSVESSNETNTVNTSSGDAKTNDEAIEPLVDNLIKKLVEEKDTVNLDYTTSNGGDKQPLRHHLKFKVPAKETNCDKNSTDKNNADDIIEIILPDNEENKKRVSGITVKGDNGNKNGTNSNDDKKKKKWHDSKLVRGGFIAACVMVLGVITFFLIGH